MQILKINSRLNKISILFAILLLWTFSQFFGACENEKDSVCLRYCQHVRQCENGTYIDCEAECLCKEAVNEVTECETIVESAWKCIIGATCGHDSRCGETTKKADNCLQQQCASAQNRAACNEVGRLYCGGSLTPECLGELNCASLDPTECNTTEACNLSNYDGRCEGTLQCSSITNKEACTVPGFYNACIWSDTKSECSNLVSSCQAATKRSECVRMPGCTYIPSCEKKAYNGSCKDFVEASTCSAAPGCEWWPSSSCPETPSR